MRRTSLAWVGSLVVLAGSGCTATPEPVYRGPIEVELVDMVTAADVGGRVSPAAIPIADAGQFGSWARQFSSREFIARIQQVADQADVPEGAAAYAAIVAVGCDLPTDVRATTTDSGLLVEGVQPSTFASECPVQNTTVAVVIGQAPADQDAGGGS